MNFESTINYFFVTFHEISPILNTFLPLKFWIPN